MQEQHMYFMKIALQEALSAPITQELPVGALVVRHHRIIAKAHNETESKKSPLAHAECLALQKAHLILDKKYLEDCDLYVTLEPCPMCAYAIGLCRIRRLVFGAYNPKGGGIDHNTFIFQRFSFFSQTEIISGIQEKACSQLLKDFFMAKRHN